MGRPRHRLIFHKEKHQGLVQGYNYLAFQPQGNEEQDSAFKNLHYNKHQ
jgi:hypothetical protein